MSRYAERECHDCGIILPANEMERSSRSRLTGYTVGKRSYGSTRSFGGGGSSSERFRVETIDLCRACADQRRQAVQLAQRRSNGRAFLFVAVAICACIGLSFAIPKSSHSPAPLVPIAAATSPVTPAPRELASPPSATAEQTSDYPPEPPLTKNDRSVPGVVRDAATLDEQCRGATSDYDATCTARDGAFQRAEASGWCYGDQDTTEADAIWHPCREGNAVAVASMIASAKAIGWCPGQGIAGDDRWHRCSEDVQ